MSRGGGARPLALGGAYTALAQDAWALFWNPSGTATLERSQAGLMHSERFEGVVDYDVMAAALPQGDGSVFSVGLIRLGVNGIPFTKLEYPDQPPDAPNNRILVDRIVNEGEYALFAAKASHWRGFRWGVAPKLIFKHIGSKHQAYGLGVDVGAGSSFHWLIPWETGIAVQNALGSVLAWDTGRKEIIAPILRLGLASLISIPVIEAIVTPLADVSYRFENLGDSDAAALHWGVEYTVRDMLALRVGWDEDRLTFGGGLLFKAVDVSYAFIGHSELGETHRISVIIRWGGLRPSGA